MFISQRKAKQLIEDTLSGCLNPSDTPDWLLPLVNQIQQKINSDLKQSQLGVDISKIITHFGRDALDFNEQIAKLVDHSQMLASATEEMAATASEIEKLDHDVLNQVEKTRDQSTLRKTYLIN